MSDQFEIRTVDPQLILDTLRSLELSPMDQALILGENAQRLFKL